ncbi:MAG: hypothetical protein KF718_13105 [Polyangiaceae bacterium]|nr:hypothetical protein [Polyangiaceae bacterium]
MTAFIVSITPPDDVSVLQPETDVVQVAATSGVLTARTEGDAAVARGNGVTCVAWARLDTQDKSAASGSHSAAEVILHAFLQSGGTAFVEGLLGEFAFVLWDANSGDVTLGSDYFGVHPLFFARTGSCFRISTDLALLASTPALEREPDERAIVDYLGGFPEDETRTAWRHVRRVAPGTVVTWKGGAARTRRYWRPEEVVGDSIPDAEAPDALYDALLEAVRCRVSSVGVTAVLASGGLDSSSILALATQCGAGRVVAVSGVFPEGAAHDESSYQREVQRHLGVERIGVRIEDARELDVEASLALFGQPAAVGAEWMSLPLLRAARAAGADVALTGLDGDRVVSHGHGRLAELANDRKWRELISEADASSASRSLALRVVLGQVFATSLPRPWVLELERRVRLREVRKAPGTQLLRAEVLERVGAIDRAVADCRRVWSGRDYHLRALNRADRFADVGALAPLGRLTGVSARHPFYDRRVVECCLGIGSRLKRERGIGRVVLREAMGGLLPELVRRRSDKAAFDDAFSAWALPEIRRVRTKYPTDFELLRPYVTRSWLRKLDGPLTAEVPVDLVWRCVVVSAWLRGELTRSAPGGHFDLMPGGVRATKRLEGTFS